MHLRRWLALVGAASAAAFAACEKVPFAPKWDADMYLPLSTQPIALAGFVPAPPLNIIPAGGSASVSFPPQRQDVGGAIGSVLSKLVTDSARARTVLTLTVAKTTAIAAQDTLFVAADSLGLFGAAAGSIVFPISLLATETSKTDSTSLSVAQITMLRSAAEVVCLLGCPKPLWIQLRGKVSNPGASNITITTVDSLKIKLTVTARIAVSSR